MKLFLLLVSSVLSAQTSAPIVDVATGTRCTAAFSPATSATHVQIDCAVAGVQIAETRLLISAITGSLLGYETTFAVPNSNGKDVITMVIKRVNSTSPLIVDTVVNGAALPSKTITVP